MELHDQAATAVEIVAVIVPNRLSGVATRSAVAGTPAWPPVARAPPAATLPRLRDRDEFATLHPNPPFQGSRCALASCLSVYRRPCSPAQSATRAPARPWAGPVLNQRLKSAVSLGVCQCAADPTRRRLSDRRGYDPRSPHEARCASRRLSNCLVLD